MCGIIGVVAQVGTPASPVIYDGLTVLQHRGQDAAGIVTCDGEQLFQRKSNGLVRDVFQQRHMETLAGHMGCLLYTSPSPRDVEEARMPASG